MSITFLPGTKVIATNGINRYELLITEIQASETYVESSRDTRTLHNRNLIKDTFVKEKSNATFSFTVPFSEELAVLLNWLGCSYISGAYNLPLQKGKLSKEDYLDLYIDSGNTIFRLSSCVAESLSFRFDKSTPLSLNITGTARSMDSVIRVPSIGRLITQSKYLLGSLNVYVDETPVPRLTGVTAEISREVSWLNQNSVHQALLSSLYQKEQPVISGYSLSGAISQYKQDDMLHYKYGSSVRIIYDSTFHLHFSSCNLTDRWAIESVYKKVTDYKILPDAHNSYIKF